MKNLLKPKHLPWIILVCGLLGALLRFWLFAAGVDEKGLLVPTHPANALSFLLIPLVLAVLLLGIRPLSGLRGYDRLFPASDLAALGCLAGSLSILFTCVQALMAGLSLLSILSVLLGLAASVCLVLVGRCRRSGSMPHFLFHTVVTVYFMLRLLTQYRVWSANPQLPYYFFPLLACIFLMATAYQAVRLDAGHSNRRWFVFFDLAALFFCLMSLQGDSWAYYALMAFWAFTGLCSLEVRPPRRRES